MHVYEELDKAEGILTQVEQCGSFSLGNSRSDRGNHEQQGRGPVEDDQEEFDQLIKLKRVQLLLRSVLFVLHLFHFHILFVCVCAHYY